MADQPRGLYEALVTEALAARLRDLGQHLRPHCNDLRPADAADRIALHLGRIIHRALEGVEDNRRVEVGVALARTLVDAIGTSVTDAVASADAPLEPGTVLRAILARLPDGTPEIIPEPLVPLLDTTVLTNSPGEPRVGNPY
jgi:hypothetical protein